MASQSISFKPTTIIRQLPWSFDKKAALGLVLILLTFSLVGWLYLGQASMITSSTLQIERLQQEIKMVNQQNAELALDIAHLESLNRIEERALALGFQPTTPTQLRYLTVKNFPELVEHSVITYPIQPGEETRSIWRYWLDNLVAWMVGKPPIDALSDHRSVSF